MPLISASNFGNPHVGLFARASEVAVIADASASEKFLSSLLVLEVPVVKATFAGSGLAGIFLCMNSKGAVLPSFCSNEEIATFKRLGFNVAKLSGPFSAVANNISANDFGAIAAPELSRKDEHAASDALGVEIVKMRIAGYSTPGSAVVATNRGFCCHSRASEKELKELQSILRVEGEACTANTGTPFVSLGIIANSKAAVVGEQTTGFEMGRIGSALMVVE